MQNITPFSGKRSYIAIDNNNVYKGSNAFGNMIVKKSTFASRKLLASFVTVFLIAMLVIAGPAAAYTLNLNDFANDTPTVGEVISTTFTMNFNDDHEFKFDNLMVYVSGPMNQTCSFTMTGKLLDGETNDDPKAPNVTTVPGIGAPSDPMNVTNITKKPKKLVLVPGEPAKEVIVLDANLIHVDDDILNEGDGICANMTLELMKQKNEYGYAYSYAYEPFVLTEQNETIYITGALQYGFKIDTTGMDLGLYTVYLAVTGGKEVVESGETEFLVKAPIIDDGNNDDGTQGSSDDDSGNGKKKSSGGWGNPGKKAGSDTNESTVIPLGNPTGVTDEETPSSQSGFARITGAVIGTLGKTGALVAAIFILMLVLATAALHVRKYMVSKPAA